ncbi:MAG: hypothetical protein AB8B56_05315 [Crocinitomicaceae bacterium]
MSKRWVRVLLALFIGGALSESSRISTGNESGGLLIFGAIVSYLLMSGFVYFRNMYQIQREVDKKFKKNDNIIDDI